jgi:hypothetical protein
MNKKAYVSLLAILPVVMGLLGAGVMEIAILLSKPTPKLDCDAHLIKVGHVVIYLSESEQTELQEAGTCK